MKRTRIASIAALTASATVVGLLAAGPAQAEPLLADPDVGGQVSTFLGALSDTGVSGLGGLDPARAAAVGQQVCPLLSEPGQRVADVAADVADALGRPLGPATMFTGLAISVFCPAVVTSLADGRSPIPLPLFGI
ncbi:DUF732 domain-containing protein [Mycolicibacterium palauense]|uniref:DUF732 domain-containing protein n=1 Tax=Mycolicibacterium palauense TaxID=2034511 RepID=UPI000BFEB6D8|nr:DUF732 domain-containing protein [Mycolicibacterium palauense]